MSVGHKESRLVVIVSLILPGISFILVLAGFISEVYRRTFPDDSEIFVHTWGTDPLVASFRASVIVSLSLSAFFMWRQNYIPALGVNFVPFFFLVRWVWEFYERWIDLNRMTAEMNLSPDFPNSSFVHKILQVFLISLDTFFIAFLVVMIFWQMTLIWRTRKKL